MNGVRGRGTRAMLLCGIVSNMLSLASAQEANQVENGASTAGPLTITLQDALARARVNEPQYQAALTQYGVAKENTVQSRAALLPNVNYTTSFLYTQGNGTGAPRFIANNAVHEYSSQGNAHQAFSLQSVAEYRQARAEEALAKANSEIATRGLVMTAVQAYYGSGIAHSSHSTIQRAAAEAQPLFDI